MQLIAAVNELEESLLATVEMSGGRIHFHD